MEAEPPEVKVMPVVDRADVVKFHPAITATALPPALSVYTAKCGVEVSAP